MRIFIDENLSEYVADALNSLDKGYFSSIEVVSTKKDPGVGKPDEDIIPYIGYEKGVLVTRDLDIRKKTEQYRLCKNYKIGILFIKLPKKSNRHWEMVKLLIKHWEDFIKICTNTRTPFAFEISPNGGMKEME